MGLFALIPVTMLLTVSFFVLFAVQKTEHKGIKGLGRFAAVMLWICAFLFFSAGAVTLVKGSMAGGMHHKMMTGNCCMEKGMAGPCMMKSQVPEKK
jgi:uncharacterized membrane protein YsdA (DUF1294 family)